MIFPEGTKKEGYFENNVFKVKVQISKEQQEMERQQNARVHQEQMVEREGLSSSHTNQRGQISKQSSQKL